jgi:hypothetical protein
LWQGELKNFRGLEDCASIMLIIMRSLILGLFLIASVGCAAAQPDIRHVDFKNFSYPFFVSLTNEPGWFDMSHEESIRLTNGKNLRDSGNGMTNEGLTLEEVQFADVTGDGQTEAIVVLRYDTGGTMFSYYVYVYEFAAGKPQLLACFHAGERANSGLYRVYGQKGKLVLELYDPEKSEGLCCSTGFIRTRYIWRNGRFLQVGAKESGTPKTASRVPVSVFGIHQ